MDMMEMRRKVILAMAQGGVKIKTGTFEGDGSGSVTIPCNFYPDIIYVALVDDVSSDVSFTGIMVDIIWRDEFVYSAYDNSSTTEANLSYGNVRAQGMADYNENTLTTRNCYATVTGTSVTVKRNTTVGTYKSGHTYKYVLIKLPD